MNYCIEFSPTHITKIKNYALPRNVESTMGDMAHHPGSHFTKGQQSNSAAEHFLGFLTLI